MWYVVAVMHYSDLRKHMGFPKKIKDDHIFTELPCKTIGFSPPKPKKPKFSHTIAIMASNMQSCHSVRKLWFVLFLLGKPYG